MVSHYIASSADMNARSRVAADALLREGFTRKPSMTPDTAPAQLEAVNLDEVESKRFPTCTTSVNRCHCAL